MWLCSYPLFFQRYSSGLYECIAIYSMGGAGLGLVILSSSCQGPGVSNVG